jgi:hypothetical protein
MRSNPADDARPEGEVTLTGYGSDQERMTERLARTPAITKARRLSMIGQGVPVRHHRPSQHLLADAISTADRAAT